ncbi:hypothetical protein E2P81_ATG01673 [Venturia nashicola]|nr:hypothetical protein E2P81_ATG01673 [Venturia nashicola]
MNTSAQRSKRISITREMEEAPVHACYYCGVMAVHQCSVTHSNSLKIAGCPLFSFYCCLGHQLLDGANHLEKCEKETNTWDHDVKTMCIDDAGAKGSIVCTLGDGGKFADGKVFHGFDFDEALLEELETKFGNVREAVLTTGTSEHAAACLYKLVEYFLGGLTNPGTSENKADSECNYAPNHCVYKLTTKTGDEYALDITRIQYGNDCICFHREHIALHLRVFSESHIRLHNALTPPHSQLSKLLTGK